MRALENYPMTLLILVLAGLLLTGCDREQAAAPAPRGPVEVDIITLAPKKDPIPLSTELPGRTTAFRTAEVRPQVNGIIQKRLFEEGSEVAAGQLLYQIDAAVYQAAFDSARANLAKAKAQEVSARQKAERYRKLISTKAISEQAQIDAEAEWQQARAAVAVAEADLASARINLEYTKVVAPISGRIGRSMASEGSLVTALQATPLATIQQIDPLYVDLNQSSMEVINLKRQLAARQSGSSTASPVTVILEDGSVYGETGSLEFADVSVNQSTGTVTLRALVANPQHLLLPGMFVRALVERGQRTDAILIPAASVTRNTKGQAVVMIVDDKRTVQGRVVSIEQNLGEQVLIGEGLAGGEQLIVAGLQKIKPGVEVRPMAAKANNQSVSTASQPAGNQG